MPTLPTVELRGQVARQRGVEIQPGPGAAIGQALQQFGEVASRIGEASDKAEAARIIAETRAQFDAAIKEEKRTQPDYRDFSSSATERVGNIHSSALRIGNSRVQQLVKAGLNDDLIRANTLIGQETFVKQKDKALVDYGVVRDTLSSGSVGADEATQQRNASEFAVLQASMVSSGFMTLREAADERKKYEDDIIIKTADMDIEDGRASQVLIDAAAGKFKRLNAETVRRISGAARAEIERQDTAAEKAHDQVKDMILNSWHGLANKGQLETKFPGELDRALEGRHPYITAAEARTIAKVNENPPSAGADPAVSNLRTRYRLSAGTIQDVRNAQRELRAILVGLGGRSEAVDKFADELQADGFRALNLQAAQAATARTLEDRGARQLKNEYDAFVEALPPVFRRFFGNLDEQNKALIEHTLRTKGEKEARELLETFKTKVEGRTNSVPKSNQEVINLVE